MKPKWDNMSPYPQSAAEPTWSPRSPGGTYGVPALSRRIGHPLSRCGTGELVRRPDATHRRGGRDGDHSTDAVDAGGGSGTTKTDHVTGQHISIIRGPMDRRRGVAARRLGDRHEPRVADHSRKKRRDPESAWNPDGLRRHLRSRRGNRSGDRGFVLGIDGPDGAYWMPLFVTLGEGYELDDALVDTIRTEIRNRLSPRHVPDVVVAAPGYLTPAPGRSWKFQ